MANFEWGSLIRLSRRSLNLTQEDFAADFGKSRSLIAQWESGRRPVPSNIKRAAIDILGGYYKNHSDIKYVIDIVDSFPSFASVLQNRHVGLYANRSFIGCWNAKMNVEYAGAAVLNHIPQDALVSVYSESHTIKMFEQNPQYVRLAIYERSVLVSDRYVVRDITRVNVGVGTVLLLRETLNENASGDADASWAVAVTMDGTEEVLVGHPPPGRLFDDLARGERRP